MILFLVLLVGCYQESVAELESFHSQQAGRHSYLLTHYDLLPVNAVQESELKKPLESGLTDQEWTILRESFSRVGQCVYRLTSDQALDINDPQVFRQMLSDAQPLMRKKTCHEVIAKTGLCQQQPAKHSYAPLDQVLAEMQGVRELYAYRMPWYYDYLAMGLSFAVLNGLFDIVTHNAQREVIKIADDYVKSPTHQQNIAGNANAITEAREQVEGIQLSNKEISEKEVVRAKNKIRFIEDKLNLTEKTDRLYLDLAKSEHKAEELFGRVLYFGRETNVFGKTVNLNPLWTLKERIGNKLVPLVKKHCVGLKALRYCLPLIVFSVAGMIGTIAPFNSIWTAKISSLIHRQREQQTLDDLIGDWDAIRTFSHVRPEVMSKIEQKFRRLASEGDQPCPEAKSLIARYIDPQTGRFR